jgi:RNA polymerase sigma-70 factor (ECF subfamily)
MGALRLLPDQFREALILVSASGFSYEQAAKICDRPVGTVKSRVFPARQALVVNFNTMPAV